MWPSGLAISQEDQMEGDQNASSNGNPGTKPTEAEAGHQLGGQTI